MVCFCPYTQIVDMARPHLCRGTRCGHWPGRSD